MHEGRRGYAMMTLMRLVCFVATCSTCRMCGRYCFLYSRKLKWRKISLEQEDLVSAVKLYSQLIHKHLEGGLPRHTVLYKMGI